MELRLGIRTPEESYEQLRARLVSETSAYLTECLRHPEYAVRIPVIRAGAGRFPPSLTLSFWEPILRE